MSGPIADLPIRICDACRALYMEDENMQEETNRCPRCGHELGTAEKGETEEFQWGHLS